MGVKFAERMNHITASEIRETLKLIANPEIISFAGGNPDPDTFPVEIIGNVTSTILNTEGGMALQYSPTEGFDPLRKKIAERVKTFGIETSFEKILITSGSQQALSLTGDVFLNEGDSIVCENPTYFGALNAFRKYQPEIIDIETHNDGMDIDELENVLKTRKNVKLIYVIPEYQNPTGNTWSIEKRKKIAEVSAKYEIPVIEDNPYYEINFSGEKKPTLKHFDKAGNIIFLGSYSKTFCPGLRIGWVNAEQEILNKYIIMKQGADLQTNTLSQRQLFYFLDNYDFDEHISKMKKLYMERRDLMVSLIKKYFPAECKYTIPDGGFFIWVELPEHINGKKLLIKSIENKVAFISGSSFYANGGKENCIRLSYSTMKNDKILEGMKRLGDTLKEFEI